MSGDHLWPILFGISLAVNVILLLYRPVLAWLRRDKGEELADEIMAMVEEGEESGAIEQDADVVMFIYRDEYYNKDSEYKKQAEIIIAKQRNGPVGTVHLAWLGEYTKFANLSRQD